jgi:hypothetical protein
MPPEPRPRATPIRGLLLPCRPAAVAGRVRPVVIDAIERVPGTRLWTHVGDKKLEVAPPRVHVDAATSVLGAILASPVHIPPGDKEGVAALRRCARIDLRVFAAAGPNLRGVFGGAASTAGEAPDDGLNTPSRESVFGRKVSR